MDTSASKEPESHFPIGPGQRGKNDSFHLPTATKNWKGDFLKSGTPFCIFLFQATPPPGKLSFDKSESTEVGDRSL